MALVKTLLRKRVNLSLQPDEYDLLTRLAKARGRSRAGVLEDVFHELRPVFERVVAAVEAAQKAEDAAKKGLRAAVERSEAVVESHAQAAVRQVDWLLNEAQGLSPAADPGRDAQAAGPGRRVSKARKGGTGRRVKAARRRSGARRK
jgi:hypothetical protein